MVVYFSALPVILSVFALNLAARAYAAVLIARQKVHIEFPLPFGIRAFFPSAFKVGENVGYYIFGEFVFFFFTDIPVILCGIIQFISPFFFCPALKEVLKVSPFLLLTRRPSFL